MTIPSRHQQRAERHRERAISYRDDANLLMQQYGRRDSAGALLYESAKQCINALANQAGRNPGTTGAKTAYLHTVANQLPGNRFNLVSGFQAASQLHLHADRGHLSAADFEIVHRDAQIFIANMLAIYAAGP